MKTTIEIDEDKLDAVMKTGGFKTRKDTIDWALNEALRIATINKIVETPWTVAEAKAAVDPSYDVIAMRSQSPVSLKHSTTKRARTKGIQTSLSIQRSTSDGGDLAKIQGRS